MCAAARTASQVQYWTSVDSNATAFTSPLMRDGCYNATICKNQISMSSDSVLIAAGSTKTQTLDVMYGLVSDYIWRIGEWAGTPDGFLNAASIHTMHPIDSHLDTWVEALIFAPGTDDDGTDDDSTFPMAMFRAVTAHDILRTAALSKFIDHDGVKVLDPAE